MKRLLAVVCLVSIAAISAACKEKRTERVAASYSTETQPNYRSAPPFQPQKVPVGIDAVPVEEDYEVRAASTITGDDVQAKLAELERELSL